MMITVILILGEDIHAFAMMQEHEPGERMQRNTREVLGLVIFKIIINHRTICRLISGV